MLAKMVYPQLTGHLLQEERGLKLEHAWPATVRRILHVIFAKCKPQNEWEFPVSQNKLSKAYEGRRNDTHMGLSQTQDDAMILATEEKRLQ